MLPSSPRLTLEKPRELSPSLPEIGSSTTKVSSDMSYKFHINQPVQVDYGEGTLHVGTITGFGGFSTQNPIVGEEIYIVTLANPLTVKGLENCTTALAHCSTLKPYNRFLATPNTCQIGDVVKFDSPLLDNGRDDLYLVVKIDDWVTEDEPASVENHGSIELQYLGHANPKPKNPGYLRVGEMESAVHFQHEVNLVIVKPSRLGLMA